MPADARPEIPLARWADRRLTELACASGSSAIAALSGAGLLGQRAALNGFAIPGLISPGGGCRLLRAQGDWIALNLARPDDRDLLPALFGDATMDPWDDDAIAGHLAKSDSAALLDRGRTLGLAIAAMSERLAADPTQTRSSPSGGGGSRSETEGAREGADLASGPAPSPVLRTGPPPGGEDLSDSDLRLAPMVPATMLLARGPHREPPAHRPLVVDLSALWAGPLCGHLLRLAGADVVKVEHPRRADSMRNGDPALFAGLNHGKANLTIDFATASGRAELLSLIARADIVIEAARPRALVQLGIDAQALVAAQPGLVWLTITGHGARAPQADWVGFGDDTAVAGGLTAAMFAAGGTIGFGGDAPGDPLTGIMAALAGWRAWRSGTAQRIGLAMSSVVAEALAEERAADDIALTATLRAWSQARGTPFPGRAPLPSC